MYEISKTNKFIMRYDKNHNYLPFISCNFGIIFFLIAYKILMQNLQLNYSCQEIKPSSILIYDQRKARKILEYCIHCNLYFFRLVLFNALVNILLSKIFHSKALNKKRGEF